LSKILVHFFDHFNVKCHIDIFKRLIAKDLKTCAKLQKSVFVLEKKHNFIYMNKIKGFVEWHIFGVCTAIGEKMGIATSIIRKYFIYISFMTIGSPLIIYLFVAFWMNVKKYVRISRGNPAGF